VPLSKGDVNAGLKKGNVPVAPPAAPPQKPIVLRRSRTVVPAPVQQPQQPVDEPPHPILQQHGFNGGIQQFNQRVQAVHDDYQNSYGQPPTPGLVLDLAKSPLNTGDFSKLFTVPKDPLAARARGAVNSTPPEKQLVVRHDGLVEQNNPIAARLIANEKTSTPNVAATPNPTSPAMAKYQALQKQHPWVAMGMLPIGDNDVEKFWNAVSYAQGHPAAAQPLKVGGETLQQYQQENVLGESLVGARPGENPGLVSQGYGKPASTENLDTTAALRARQGVAQGVTTVRAAQDALKKVAPDYFANLPSSGFINQDWAKALGQYQTSPQYFRQQTVRLAHDNHFGSNTSAFINAWKTKQAAIKKQPFLANFIAHQPLALFDTRTHGAAVINLLSGNTKGWGWANVPTVGLNVITNTAGLVFNEAAGTVDQAKIDASYVTAYMQAIMPKNVSIPGTAITGEGLTEKQAREKAAKVLFEKPTWSRVIDPNLGTDKDWIPFSKQAAPIFNAAVDLWIGSAKFTGEEVAAGDIASASSSRYLQNKSAFAFNSLKKGDLGGAVASLEGGRGAENLAAALESGVKDGSVSQQQFQQHVSELYAQGHTTVGEARINGPLLNSLRTKDLPTPGRIGTTASKVHQTVKSVLDNFENSMRARKQVGATSHAADLVASVRQQFARAAPANERRAIFDTRTPDDVYNWARVNLKDQKVAAGLRDDFIRLRAKDDVQGITDLNNKMRALYAKAHPDSEIARTPLEATQGPQIESESRTYLTFPKSIETRAQSINAALNKAGRLHREVIVSGSPNPLIFPLVPGFGESLLYKHAIADTARRVVGGGGVFGITGELKGAKAAVEAYAKEDPEALRLLGVNRDSAVAGENRYITGQKPTDTVNFNTGEKLNLATNRPLETKAAQEAAGGYLRRLISSRALKAYQASTASDLGPMIDLIQNDKELQSLLYKDARTFTPSTKFQKIPDGLELPTGAEVAVKGNVRYVRWPEGAVPQPIRFGGLTATEAAEALYKRYQDVEKAGFEQGMTDPLGDAQALLIRSLGPKADQKLGKWIDDNQMNFPVRDGLVPRKQFDDVMQAWIGRLMTANKWNRGKIYDHVLYSTVNDLTKAGWEMKDAVPVAADLAKAQTVYHMLDFSNMLQVEQNLRWLSYFATKHRLYWTWILRQAARRPGLDALVGDAQDHLDKNGNLKLPLSVAGYNLAIPAARLFWANATEYPQTSPVVQGAFEYGKGILEGHGPAGAVNDALGSLTSTSGNLVTRDDQAELWAIKLAGVTSGKIPATADSVTLGLSPSQQQQFFHAVNEYSAFYKAKHGDWPTEQDAVRHVLVGQTASTFWNTNLFLPVTVTKADQKVSGSVQKLLSEYGHIVNPVKKREFLDQHPEVALHFGVNEDPAVFLHNNKLWDQFNAAQNALANSRQQVYQGILKNGQVTAADLENESKLSAQWAKTINKLQLEDAATWPGNSQFPAGKVSDNQVVTPGPWGKALEGDPYASRAFLHQVFPNIPPAKLNGHTVGETVVQLQAESRRLALVKNNLAAAKKLGYADLESVKTRLSAISQILAPFYAYPKDAPAKLEDEYYSKYVTPYIQQRTAKTNAIALAPEDQQDALRSSLRAWKDSHDHPVYINVDGKRIKFPSVVQIGWARLPGPTRHQALAQAVTGDWSHIASYEKTLLGVKTSPGVSQGWSAYYDTVGEYNKNPGNSSLVASQKTSLAKQIDKVYPGFYKDYLFAQQPKVDRYERTTLYQQMPKTEKAQFDQYIGGPAKQLSKAIKANGNRNYYEKSWRNYVETEVQPWLQSQPALRNELSLYGPNFLNTLVSTSG